MELHFAPKPLHHAQLGDEKHQMLNLNRRLETYLSRVKHLEEENATLAGEIGSLTRSKHGASTRRRGLEEELRQARLELEAAWRDKAQAEMEVGRLAEEFQVLDQQRQWEAQAHVKAKKMLEQSKKELDEEQRAQMWLRQQVSQLEQEMGHLIQTHQDDVAHMESALIHSTVTRAPEAPRGHQTPNLLQLGQEFSQRATRAWQEAAEAHQVQLAQLEESLNEARGRLTRVAQEKSESQLRLRALEKEMESAQDVKLHLEETAAQQSDKHQLEIQQMQAHLEGLEAEREDLGRQIQRLLLENRGLLQMKMSLGLEVSTYRALLDSEGLMGDRCPSSRDISMTDAAFRPRGARKTSVSSLSVRAAPPCSRTPTTFTPTPKTSRKPADKDAAKTETWARPYPKILQDGAVESFRPQEVQEKVTYAEPLSPPEEQEACVPLTPEGGAGGGARDEAETVEAAVSRQVESSLRSSPSFREESSVPQFTAPSRTEESRDVSTDSEEVSMEAAPAEAAGRRDEEHVQEVTSTPETEEELDPSGTRGPEDQVTELSSGDTEETREDTDGSLMGPKETDAGDKMLYPDGEEMDTWDNVIERKIDLKTDDGIKEEEAERQHAEAEDISAGEPDTRRTLQDVPTGTDKQVDDEGQEHEEEDEEEDSQNVEPESDSYAQDNTLADTRPLIRYKSDETDGNTQASHLEESESSEGEQDRRPGETGGGAWSECKSRRYGTMEDLCEEVEEEEELGHTRSDEKDSEREEEVKEKEVSEEESDEDTEGFTKPPMDEELETDRLVEQELENLSTESFSSLLAATTRGQLPEELQEGPSVPEERQGQDEHSVSMVTHPEEEEHFPSSSDVMEDLSNSELQENTDARPEEPQEHLEHLVEDCPHVPETGEWEVLENPREASDIRDNTDLKQDSAERLLHDDGGSGEEAGTHEEEHLELSPDHPPQGGEIFAVEDKNRKDNVPGVFSSGVKTDFWTSSSETGAACQPDDAYIEQTNQNVGFGQDSLWGMSHMRNVVNGQEHESEGKQGLGRKVEAEFVHSEESEVEAESWSSGEEQV